MEMVPLAPGPASESRQRTNPQRKWCSRCLVKGAPGLQMEVVIRTSICSGDWSLGNVVGNPISEIV